MADPRFSFPYCVSWLLEIPPRYNAQKSAGMTIITRLNCAPVAYVGFHGPLTADRISKAAEILAVGSSDGIDPGLAILVDGTRTTEPYVSPMEIMRIVQTQRKRQRPPKTAPIACICPTLKTLLLMRFFSVISHTSGLRPETDYFSTQSTREAIDWLCLSQAFEENIPDRMFQEVLMLRAEKPKGLSRFQ